MQIGEHVHVVEGAVYPVKATSTRIDDSPNVTEQIGAASRGQDGFPIFCGKNDVVADLGVC